MSDITANRKEKKLLPWALVIVAVLIVCTLCICAAADPYDCKIMPNVTVGGLDIGGMTPVEAYRALKTASSAVLESTVLSAELPEETIPLSPADTKASLRTLSAVLAAYKAGRVHNQGPSIGLESHLKLDKQYIRDALASYAARYDTNLTQSSYTLSGTMPDLEVENQDSGNTPQVLELTMGLPTARLDQDAAFANILAVYDRAFSAAETGNYSAQNFKVDILEVPEQPNAKTIHDVVSIAPVDDSLDMDTYEAVPGAYGYGFDLEEADKLIRQAEYGDVLSIPMEFQEPEIFGDEVYFRDVLGSCETPHTQDENRNHNLRLACEAMNGMILQPGDVFSYNETLGPRTKERGYLRAGAYSGWELVMSYGGGICQGSSTVYCATLYADLEIVHRVNHGRKVGYMDAGLDATVSWNGPDFQFRNNTNFPIKITAEVSDGYVKVALLGTEERDYYVEMEVEKGWGSTVLYTRSYKCKYDRETGELISRELEARSNYAI